MFSDLIEFYMNCMFIKSAYQSITPNLLKYIKLLHVLNTLYFEPSFRKGRCNCVTSHRGGNSRRI